MLWRLFFLTLICGLVISGIIKPSEDVAVHFVDVPVDKRTIPLVPALLLGSYNPPVKAMSPFILNDLVGEVDPMPNLPLDAKVNILKPDDDAITRGFLPAVPVIERFAVGVEEPIPTLPFELTLKNELLLDEAMLKSGVSCPLLP